MLFEEIIAQLIALGAAKIFDMVKAYAVCYVAIIGVTQVIKNQGWWSHKLTPLVVLVLCEAVVYGYAYSTGIWTRLEWLVGLLMAAAACGGFSAFKNLSEAFGIVKSK